MWEVTRVRDRSVIICAWEGAQVSRSIGWPGSPGHQDPHHAPAQARHLRGGSSLEGEWWGRQGLYSTSSISSCPGLALGKLGKGRPLRLVQGCCWSTADSWAGGISGAFTGPSSRHGDGWGSQIYQLCPGLNPGQGPRVLTDASSACSGGGGSLQGDWLAALLSDHPY